MDPEPSDTNNVCMNAADDTDEVPIDRSLDTLADSCADIIRAWRQFGGLALAAAPKETSQLIADVRQFESFNGTSPKNVGRAAGQFAGLYVDVISQHVAAFESLVRARRLTVGPWPIVRAALEVAGRVAWLVEPSLGAQSGERRVARFYLESISSLQRDRYTRGRYDNAQANRAKKSRDVQIAEAVGIFDDVQLDLSSMESIERWTIHGEAYVGLGAGVQRFTDLCFTEARGLYDHLSDYAHPSLLATVRQTTPAERDGITSRPWTTPLATVEHQARLCCLVLYKAAHLIAEYYEADTAVLEDWADAAPAAWFNTTPGGATSADEISAE